MLNSDKKSIDESSDEQLFPLQFNHYYNHYNNIDEAFVQQIAKKYAYINQRISCIENRLMTILIERNIQLQNANTNENIKLMRTFSTTVISSLNTLTELNGKLTTILGNCTTDNNTDNNNLCHSNDADEVQKYKKKIYKNLTKQITIYWNYLCTKWILCKNLDISLWLILFLFILFICN